MLRYFWPSDDEQLAGQFVDSHLDEDGAWWNNILQAGAVFALATALSLAATTTAVASAVFSQHQDDPAGNLTALQLAQEEYWQNPVAPVNWPQPSIFAADDTHNAFVESFQADEDFWQNPTPPVPATNFVRLPFLDPEEIPVGSFPSANNPVDDSAIWAPVPPAYEAPWNIILFLDDGSWVPAFQPDEDFWINPVPPVVWPQPGQPFSDSDENNRVPEFVAAEDPVWLQLVAPVPSTLAWPQQWQFEQNEPGNLVAFADEIFWVNPVPPVPATMFVLRQDAFEQHDATGSLTLTLDDGFQPNFVAPVPASLALLQQWPFEQNEPAGNLRNTVDEDFWINPVPPVNWPQPSVFTDDVFVASPPNTGQDEDYWNYFMAPLVPPVPPSMLVTFPYLPDPEEIPAGNLFPTPPVVPCFKPLPPSGPDADTSISVFSNFKGGPVLALFCRICNSGQPLVVRGDYAIWCQDCCAFVSKQDTYMGTVRAPGQFKNRF